MLTMTFSPMSMRPSSVAEPMCGSSTTLPARASLRSFGFTAGACPHTPSSYHLLSARRLKLIRSDAYIVNTARGEVIDEDTMTRLIEQGEIGGAGLDVYENEPAVNPKLVRLAKAGKVTLLPHMGSATIEGRIDMGEKVIVNIKSFVDGHKPPDRVIPAML